MPVPIPGSAGRLIFPAMLRQIVAHRVGRIRIRFVMDGYEHNNNADGFYVDNVLVGPRQDEVMRSIASNAFSDPVRNMDNWVPEGYWGLSPELNRGGSGPATLGTWQETWWHCGTACDSLTTNWRFRVDVDAFLDNGGIKPSCAIRQSSSAGRQLTISDTMRQTWVLRLHQ